MWGFVCVCYLFWGGGVVVCLFILLSPKKSPPFEFQGILFLFSVSPKCKFL